MPRELNAADFIRHVWRRLWVLVAGGVVASLVSVGVVKTSVKSTYESSALLMMRTSAGSLTLSRRIEPLEPKVYEDILTSAELLHEVIGRTRKKFESFSQENWERSAEKFDVASILTRDTAVSARYSPVIRLTVKWNDPEIARFMMDEWLALVLERYGQLRALEAESTVAAAGEAIKRLSTELEAKVDRQAALERQLSELNVNIQSSTAMLGGEAQGESALAGTASLPAQIVALEMQAAAATGDEAVQRQLVRAKELATQLRTQLSTDTEQRAKVVSQLDLLRAELSMVRAQLSQHRTVYESAVVDSEPPVDPIRGDDVRGDLILLSAPVTPEASVGMSKALIAGGIAALLSLIVLLAVVVEFYLKWALEDEKR